MRGRHTPPAPLERGGSGASFLSVMSDLWRGCFPSREGIEGCVMVRGAGWDEMLFATVWRCGVSWLRVVALGFRWLCADVTHPRPSQEGRFGMLVSCW